MDQLKVLELFGGIGACSKALEKLGIDYEIADYVEIDKYAVASFNAIHNTNFEPQDITQWDKDIEVDLVMHGSPCQDFSLAGLQAGGDEGSGTRSSLMYETIRIVKKLKPKYVVWENVKNIISKKHKHNFDAYITQLRLLGYYSYYQILNAKDYGIPQNRERVFCVSIRSDVNSYGCHVFNYIFPKKQELKLRLKDMLEDNVDEKYYLSDKMIKYISATGTVNFKNPDCKINLDIARPITTDPNKRVGTTNYLSDDFPDNYDLNGSSYLRNFGSKGKLQDKEYCDTLTASMGTGGGNVPILKIKNATKQGYAEAIDGDSVNLEYPNSETRRGRVGKQVSQTLQCNDLMGVVSNLRIRKLTPKECWRLMGFDDEDFDKASKVNSNAQLYKQAGNSIVVNVLEAILKQLLDK